MFEKSDFVKNLITFVGASAGMLLTAIGVIFAVYASLMLIVFKDTYYTSYYSFDSEFQECERFNVDKIKAIALLDTGKQYKSNEIPASMPDVYPLVVLYSPQEAKAIISKLDKEKEEFLRQQYEQCVSRVKQRAQTGFRNEQISKIITGFAFLVIGAPLWWFYQRRRDKSLA